MPRDTEVLRKLAEAEVYVTYDYHNYAVDRWEAGRAGYGWGVAAITLDDFRDVV